MSGYVDMTLFGHCGPCRTEAQLIRTRKKAGIRLNPGCRRKEPR